MYAATAAELGTLVEASTTFLGILGGSVTVLSGWFALTAYLPDDPPDSVAQRVNEGLALGFLFGLPWAVVAFIVTLIG